MDQTPRFDPWTEAARSYDFVLKNRRMLAITAAPWALFLIALHLLFASLDLAFGGIPSNAETAIMLIGHVAVLFIGAGLAVCWHRFIMLNEMPFVRLGMPTRRLLRYFGYCVLLSAAFAALYLTSLRAMLYIDLVSALAYRALDWTAYVAVIVAVTRFSLTLPAAAIDESRMTLLASWGFTTKRALRFFIGLCAVVVPISLLQDLLADALWRLPDEVASAALFLARVADIVTILLLVALAATYLSFAYMQLVEKPSENAA